MSKQELIKELYELIDLWSHTVSSELDPDDEYEVIETSDLKNLLKKAESEIKFCETIKK